MLARVQNDWEHTDFFPVTNRVKQGCVLAQTLFSMMFRSDDCFPIRCRFNGKLFNPRRVKGTDRHARLGVFKHCADLFLFGMKTPADQDILLSRIMLDYICSPPPCANMPLSYIVQNMRTHIQAKVFIGILGVGGGDNIWQRLIFFSKIIGIHTLQVSQVLL